MTGDLFCMWDCFDTGVDESRTLASDPPARRQETVKSTAQTHTQQSQSER